MSGGVVKELRTKIYLGLQEPSVERGTVSPSPFCITLARPLAPIHYPTHFSPSFAPPAQASFMAPFGRSDGRTHRGTTGMRTH